MIDRCSDKEIDRRLNNQWGKKCWILPTLTMQLITICEALLLIDGNSSNTHAEISITREAAEYIRTNIQLIQAPKQRFDNSRSFQISNEFSTFARLLQSGKIRDSPSSLIKEITEGLSIISKRQTLVISYLLEEGVDTFNDSDLCYIAEILSKVEDEILEYQRYLWNVW